MTLRLSTRRSSESRYIRCPILCRCFRLPGMLAKGAPPTRSGFWAEAFQKDVVAMRLGIKVTSLFRGGACRDSEGVWQPARAACLRTDFVPVSPFAGTTRTPRGKLGAMFRRPGCQGRTGGSLLWSIRGIQGEDAAQMRFSETASWLGCETWSWETEDGCGGCVHVAAHGRSTRNGSAVPGVWHVSKAQTRGTW